MPVHTQVRDRILRIVVDGDYTADEMSRVAGAALAGASGRVAVLLDLSGAAAPRARSAEARADTMRFLTDHPGRVARLALVAPGELAARLVEDAMVLHAGSDLTIEAFRSGLEARAWLEREGHGEDVG